MSTDYKDRMSQMYLDQVGRIATSLRRLADRVEQQGQPREVHVGPKFPHASAAQRVIHDVTWGVANLHLDQLLDFALDVEDASLKERSEA